MRMDVTPLRDSRDFRLLFVAGTVFYFGAMVSYVAIPFQIYRLTGSNFAVGAIGLVELVPLIFFGLYGGALADHVDRRRLLIGCGVAQAVLTAVLGVNAFREDPSVSLIFVVSAFLAAASSMQRPSREALMPRTVAPRPDHGRQRADQLRHADRRAGRPGRRRPADRLRRHRLVLRGRRRAALVDRDRCCSSLMRPYPHREETTPPSLAGIREGMRYALRRRDLLGTYLVDIAAMFLAMPVVLFPALVEDVFRAPELLGLLYSAETVGALVATALSGWTVAGAPPRPGDRDRGRGVRRLHRRWPA